jgi:integrase
VGRSIELERLWVEFRADREKRGRDPAWVTNLGVAIRSFLAGRELRPASSVTTAEVDAWITGNGWSPKTQRNYLSCLSSMLTWGKIVPNPCARIELARQTESEPHVLSVEACERLLTAAMDGLGKVYDRKTGDFIEGRPVYRPLLGYVSLAMFGGIRPEELSRSGRAALDLESAVFIVHANVAKPGRGKTRRRRVVELAANAVAWLRVWNEQCPGDWILPKSFGPRWEELRRKAECWPWPHDALRHTFATMHYAAHQNETLLKAQMGHSRGEDTLFQHYRAVQLPDGQMVTKAMADRFWALLPRQ